MVVCDGNLITGQNPQSSKKVAEAVAEAVAPPLREPVHGKGEGEGLHHRGHAFADEHHHEHGEERKPPHPQAHMSQWHSPIRQTTHTSSETRHGRPDRSYVG
jgi:hypothetical protein